MSGKKPEKDRQHIDTIRGIIGFGTFVLAFICEKELDRQMGKPSVLLILFMLGLCVITLIMLLPIAFRGVPEAIARKCNKGRSPSGGHTTAKLWISLKPIPMTPLTRTAMVQAGTIHSLMIKTKER